MKDLTSNKKLLSYLESLELEIKDGYVFGSQIIARIRKDLISGELRLHDNISNMTELKHCENQNKIQNSMINY